MDPKELQNILVEAYQGAPQPIQEYLSSGKSEEHLTYLKERFGLSAEASTALSNEILLCLLGISDPLRIAERLPVDSGFALDVIGPLSAETIRVVFEPLRKKTALTAASKGKPAQTPAASAPITPPAPINRLAAPATTSAPKTEPTPAPVTPAPKPVISAPAPKPVVSTPTAPVKIAPPVVSPPPSAAPLQKIAPVVAPIEVKPKPTPPPTATSVPPPPPVPPLMPETPAVVKAKPSDTPPSSAPLRADALKKTDPYREPIE